MNILQSTVWEDDAACLRLTPVAYACMACGILFSGWSLPGGGQAGSTAPPNRKCRLARIVLLLHASFRGSLLLLHACLLFGTCKTSFYEGVLFVLTVSRIDWLGTHLKLLLLSCPLVPSAHGLINFTDTKKQFSAFLKNSFADGGGGGGGWGKTCPKTKNCPKKTIIVKHKKKIN